MKKTKAILLVYGEGGHKEQMKRLLQLFTADTGSDVLFIGICENNHTIDNLSVNYSLPPLRDKYNKYKTIYKIPISIYLYLKILIHINVNYNITSVVSTGPGIAIPVAIFFKMFKKKIIFIETWSRFTTKSLTGKIMYKIADQFYIQNKSLESLYPNASYSGIL